MTKFRFTFSPERERERASSRAGRPADPNLPDVMDECTYLYQKTRRHFGRQCVFNDVPARLIVSRSSAGTRTEDSASNLAPVRVGKLEFSWDSSSTVTQSKVRLLLSYGIRSNLNEARVDSFARPLPPPRRAGLDSVDRTQRHGHVPQRRRMERRRGRRRQYRSETI